MSHPVREDIYQYLSGTLLPLLGKNEVTVVANTFFNAVADGNQGGQNLEHGNIYKEDDMEIEIATVHAVKGETHAATLYLETFFNKKLFFSCIIFFVFVKSRL